MTPREMEQSCLAAIKGGHSVTLTTPKGWRMASGFPRGELLSENKQWVNRSYKPEAVLRWMRENLLIEAVSGTAPSRRTDRPAAMKAGANI
jgi:hypothetical protein